MKKTHTGMIVVGCVIAAIGFALWFTVGADSINDIGSWIGPLFIGSGFARLAIGLDWQRFGGR